jgi:hypothetical protein
VVSEQLRVDRPVRAFVRCVLHRTRTLPGLPQLRPIRLTLVLPDERQDASSLGGPARIGRSCHTLRELGASAREFDS